MNPPGNLDWRPAAEGSGLVAPVVAEAMAGLGIDARVAPIDAALADTAAFCEAYDVSLAASANCVVVEGRRAERTVLAAVMVLATDRADVNRVVRKHLGVRKISFASMEVATSESQMAYGGITPIGLPTDWPILVDEDVVDGGWLVVGSGVRGSKIAITGTDLARLPGVEILSLTI